jgi:hypothetical protein
MNNRILLSFTMTQQPVANPVPNELYRQRERMMK